MKRFAYILSALLGLCYLLFSAQRVCASPFDGTATNTPSFTAHAMSPLSQAINRIQRDASLRLTQTTAALKGRTWGPSLAFAFVFAFLYGCIHAIGPGHGKAIVIGYFLSPHAKFMRGVWLSIWIAWTHVVSAIVVVGIFTFLLGQAFTSVEDQHLVRLVSYGAIAVFGCILLIQTLRSGKDEHCCAYKHHEHHDGRDRTSQIMAIVAGMVPCTGSLLVLTYTIANGLYVAGILLVLAIGVGMASTTALLGIGTAFARRHLLQGFSARHPETSLRLVRILSLAGPLLVLITGSTLFVFTLSAT